MVQAVDVEWESRVALDEKPHDWLMAAKDGLHFAGWLG